MDINYLIGGSKASGAETRILNTLLKCPKEKGARTNLFIRKTLLNSFCEKGFGGNIFSEIENIYIIKDTFNGKKNTFIYFISLLYINFVLLIKYRKSVAHICIFKPYFFPSLFIFKKVFFEITSPDIAALKGFYKYFNYFKSIELICVSENVESVFKRNFPNLSRKYSVNTRRFPFFTFQKESPKATVVKNKEVVFAHRLIERKNPKLCLEVFKEVAALKPDWVFSIYGDGPLSTYLDHEVSKFNGNNLFFKGYCANMDEILSKSLVFVSLIEPDNYPSQSILKAMEFKNALLIADTGMGSHRFIKNNGVLSPLSKIKLVSNLLTILNNEPEFQGLNSKDVLQNEFSIDSYLMEHRKIVENI